LSSSFNCVSNEDYSKFIHLSRYSRWLEDEGRRESWEESIDRYIDFMYQQAKNNTSVSKEDLHELHEILGATCEE